MVQSIDENIELRWHIVFSFNTIFCTSYVSTKVLSQSIFLSMFWESYVVLPHLMTCLT
jgi:hypothetical protein